MATEPIRILRIINRFNLGGPTFNVAYLSKFMSAPFETKLIGGMKDESEASSDFIVNSIGLNPEYIPEMKRSISLKSDKLAYDQISKIIKEYKPHIVHTHASKAGTLGRLAAINNKVPIVLHTFHGHVFHSYFGTLQTFIYKTIERYLAKRSTKIIAISNKQKEELSSDHKIAQAEHIEVIPLGFDLSRFTENQEEKRKVFREKYGLTENDVAVSIIGRLVPVKNHNLFLESISKLTEAAKANAKFFIVGDGESKAELIEKAWALNLNFVEQEQVSKDKPICFTSWIKEIDDVVAGSDVICLTSFNEGTPVSLIEAQAGAKPIVSTKVGGIEDIVIENKTALLSETGDSDLFAKHLSTLILDKERRLIMGVEGRKNVLTKFSYKRLVSDMHSLYIKLLNQKNINV